MTDTKTSAVVATGPKPPSKLAGMFGYFSGFAPWIVYWILSGNVPFRTSMLVAFLLSLVLVASSLVRGKDLKVLEVGDAIAFGVLTALAFATNDAFLERWIQPIGNAALGLIMLTSILVGTPFTLQYAREAVSPDLWHNPGFILVNRILAWVWVGALGVMTVLALIPPIVQGDATMLDGGSTLSILCYWVAPFSVMGLAIVFTSKYPDWFSAEFDDAPPTDATTVVATPPPTTPIRLTGAGDHAVSGSLMLDATPGDALIDEPVHFTVNGATPATAVTLSATTVDLVGNRWRSEATFAADADGRVDTVTAKPTKGTYASSDGSGLLWSMAYATPDGTPDLFIPSPFPSAVAIEASVGTATLTRTIVRRGAANGVHQIELRDDTLVARLFLPDSATIPASGLPAVALFHGSEGGLDSQSSNAALLASHGYAAMVVAYFGAQGLPEQLVEIPVERLADGVRRLADRPEVDAARVGAMAISRGSEGLLATAAHTPDLGLRAIVAVSPSSVTWEAMGDTGSIADTASWTVHGAPLPFLAMNDEMLMKDAAKDAIRTRGHVDRHRPHLMHLTRAYGAALRDHASAEAAAIPAETITAPILLLSGSDDQVWPSATMADVILARRAAAGIGAHDHHQTYSGAGHLIRLGIMPTTVSSTGGIALGGTSAGTAAAQHDATARTLAFLDRNLAATPVLGQ